MSTLMSRDINLTRSSTRVHQTPGGTSSISFGDGYTEPERARKQTNQQAGPAQNNYNDYQQAAPARRTGGGESSISFNDGYVEPSATRRPSYQQNAPQQNYQQDRYQQQAAPSRGQNNIFQDQEYENRQPAQRANRRPSSSPDKGSMKGVMSNDYSAPDSFRRVRQAPGGTSSIVIG